MHDNFRGFASQKTNNSLQERQNNSEGSINLTSTWNENKKCHFSADRPELGQAGGTVRDSFVAQATLQRNLDPWHFRAGNLTFENNSQIIS